MEYQIAYCYNDDYLFTGSTECPPDPLETQMAGHYVPQIPGHSTLKAPPEFDPETHKCYYEPDTDTWRLEELPPAPEPGGEEELPEPGPSIDERLEELERNQTDVQNALEAILEVYENA